MDAKHISVNELAKVLDVSSVIVEMFSKSLFNEVPVNGFTKSQAESIKNELLHPFSKSHIEVKKVIENTADKWIEKVLGM